MRNEPILPNGSAISTATFGILLQQRDQVGQRGFHPVHLAVLQRRRGRGAIRDDLPLDPLEVNPFAAGQPVGLFVARHIAVELLEDRLRTRDPFVLLEAHRAGTDVFADLLERIGRRNPLRHNEQRWRTALSEGEQHLRVWPVQAKPDRPVIHRLQRIRPLLDRSAHRRVADHPAVDARHNILGQNRLLIVELQSRPKPEGPGLEIGGVLVGLDHLRLRLKLPVDAKQHVPDQQRRRCAPHIASSRSGRGSPDSPAARSEGPWLSAARDNRGASNEAVAAPAAAFRILSTVDLFGHLQHHPVWSFDVRGSGHACAACPTAWRNARDLAGRCLRASGRTSRTSFRRMSVSVSGHGRKLPGVTPLRRRS